MSPKTDTRDHVTSRVDQTQLVDAVNRAREEYGRRSTCLQSTEILSRATHDRPGVGDTLRALRASHQMRIDCIAFVRF